MVFHLHPDAQRLAAHCHRGDLSATLHRCGQGAAEDRFGVGAGGFPAHSTPGCVRSHGSGLRSCWAAYRRAADDRVDQDGGVTATPAQGDIVHVEHSGTPALG